MVADAWHPFGLLTGKAPYDALRNRGHLSLASWRLLEQYSEEIATTHLKPKISQGAWERLEWHRNQGHRLVLVTATVAPMAEAMARVLGMDEVMVVHQRLVLMAFWFRTWMVCTKAKGESANCGTGC